MFKKITANDLINKMEQDPDIISLKKIGYLHSRVGIHPF